ncbi:MAG: DUF6531 domain-containing protein, partial [Bythopirellula sp.]
PNTVVFPLSLSAAVGNLEAFQLIGYNASALEHAVLEEVINNESISTVRGLKDAFVGDPIVQNTPSNSVWFVESVPDSAGAGRLVYIRGEVGARAGEGPNSLPYSEDRIDTLVTSQQAFRDVFPGHQIDPNGANTLANNPHISGLWNALNSADLDDTTVALLPQELSYVGTEISNWGGTVYVLAEDLAGNERADGYIIAAVDGPTMNGGFASGVTFPENPFIAPAATHTINFNGDPVNVLNGNMFRDELDIAMPNVGIPLSFARHYDSQSEYNVGFGRGWVHSFSDRLLRKNTPDAEFDDELIWLTSTGKRYTFTLKNGQWTVPRALFGTFGPIVGGYAYKDQNGTEHHFQTTTSAHVATSADKYIARLSKIVDRNGHGVQVDYVAGLDEFVIDEVRDIRSSNRKLEFSYPAAQVVIEKHHGGTSTPGWIYQLNVFEELLVSVTNPEQDVVEFVYADEVISKIIESDGSYHEYEYYPNGRTFRVKEGVVGQPMPQSSHSFSYNLFRNLTEFTDENGNVETYLHQEDGQLIRHSYDDRTRTSTEWGVLDNNGDVVEGTELLTRTLTDETGARETFAYFTDSNSFKYRRLRESTAKHYPGDSTSALVTQYDYEKAAHPDYSHIVNLVDIVVAPGTNQRKTSYQFDSRGRLQKAADPLHELTDPDHELVVYSYHADSHPTAYLRGLLEKESRPRSKDIDGLYPGGLAFDNSFNYNAAGQVTETIVDGQSTGTTEYHHTGLPTRITAATNIATESTYDAVGRRLTFSQLGDLSTSNDDLTTFFQYDQRGRLEKSIDALRNEITFAYDSRGNVKHEEQADGSINTFVYDAAGNRITATDGLGRSTHFVYDNRNRLVQTILPDNASARLRYDGTGRIAVTTDALGRNTEFQYDPRGLLVQTTFAAGTVDELITANGYNEFSELVQTIEDVGDTSQTVVTQHVYDQLGRLTKTQVLDRADSANPATPFHLPISVITTAYDLQGNLSETDVYDVAELANLSGFLALTSDDPRTLITSDREHVQITKHFYDASNRPTEMVFNDATQIRTEYDDAGRITATFDEKDRVTEFDYDTYGRLWKTVAPDPDGAGPTNALVSPVTYFRYDAVGNLVEELATNLGRSGSQTTRFRYDSLNRLITTIDAQLGQTSLTRDQAGQLRSATDALGRASYTKPDKRGRIELTRSADPDGDGPALATTNRFEYDAVGNLHQRIDPQGYETTFQYDSLNRLKTETYTIAHVLPDGTLSTNTANRYYDYYNNGSLRSETDSLGHTTNYAYDEIGRVETVELPAPGTDINGNALPRPKTTSYYDGYGNLRLIEEDRGGGADARATEWTYDQRNRVLTETLDRWGDEQVTTRFEYDNVGNLMLQIDDTTHSAQAVGVNATTEFRYDQLNRLTAEIAQVDDAQFDGSRLVTRLEYDALGNLTRAIDQTLSSEWTHQSITDFRYDRLGRQTRVTRDPGGDLESSTRFAYDAVGNLVSTTDALGHTTNNDYDRLDRLVSTRVPDPADSTGADELVTTLAYDILGNLIAQTNGAGETEYFVYDNLSRLIAAYDANNVAIHPVDGSVTLRQGTQRTYDSAGNLSSYTDPNGNTTTYQYDGLNRLTHETITLQGTEADRRHWYNAAGNLEQLVDRNGRVRSFQYDDLDRLQR